MEDLFYKSPEQINDIVDKFGKSVLRNKKSNVAFLSPYRTFDYQEELEKIHFGYEGQATDGFIDEFSGYFENSINFDNPGVMYNVHPNPNVYGQIASLFAQLGANPNFCMDLPAGKLLIIEKAVNQYLTSLVGWPKDKAGGIFTFGGKGTLLYALRIALGKIDPAYRENGIQNGKYFVISNDLGHPCHIEICNWLGLGKNNCIRLKTHRGVVSPEDIKDTFIDIIERGGKLPLVIINGMTTNNHTFDDVKAIKKVLQKVAKDYALDYVPHLHVDSVLGWVYLLAGRYDFSLNPLGLSKEVAASLKRKSDAAKAISYADSFAADFHKTGFCSYISSTLLVKDKDALFGIEGKYSEDGDMIFSEYAPYDYSLESSRSPHGPISAFATLKTLGAEGFITILANQNEAYRYLKESFRKQDNAIVCNYEEDSNLVFLAFKPKKYEKLEIGHDTPDKIADEIKELNTGFYNYLLDKSKNGECDLFFSCSRSYKYEGKSYGCLKIYSFNSHMDIGTAKYLHRRINELFDEYIASDSVCGHYKFFDYAEIKEAKK